MSSLLLRALIASSDALVHLVKDELDYIVGGGVTMKVRANTGKTVLSASLVLNIHRSA